MIDARAAGMVLTILLLVPAAGAVEATTVRDGDRSTGVLAAAGDEAGFSLEALEGTVLDLRVLETDGSGLEPEVLLYDPENVRLPIGTGYRHSPGSGKARLRRMTLPVTGRYTIVVRSIGDTRGPYRLRVRADHPRRFVGEGEIPAPAATGSLRFPALAGTVARVRVRGRDGLLPASDTLLEPGVEERSLPPGEVAGEIVRHREVLCEELGDYRLLVGSRNGTTGRWKGRVKLSHPATDPRELEVDGEPAGTFTAGMSEPPAPPPPGPPPATGLEAHRQQWIAQGIRDYRFTLQRMAFAPPAFTAPVVVEVRGGLVVSRRYAATGLPVDPQVAAWWPSIDGLFDILQDAVDRRADVIEVGYDPILGHPAWASVDYDLDLGDDEHSFTVSGLVRLG